MRNRLTALEVANWFVEQSLNDSSVCQDITPLKIQKLIYYAQCRYLSMTGTPLFDDTIEAWRKGPVVPEVRRTYLGPLDQRITTVFSDRHIDPKGIEYEALWKTLNEEGRLSGEELIERTHSELPYTTVYMPMKNNPMPLNLMAQVLADYSPVRDYELPSVEEIDRIQKLISAEDRKLLEELAK